MNGILCIDKPEGFTSFDVVAVMRKATHESHIGHAGTLDPFATGVLPLLFGRCAKFQDYLTVGRKKYRASVKLGVTSDTLDRTGEVTATGSAPDLAKAEETLASFVGEQLQTPPAYSAIQVRGKRLYDLARAGKAPEIPPRRIEIYSILPLSAEGDTLTFEVECSKGTYIRALARDVGEKLGCGACLWELRRLAGSGFTVDDCVSLDEAKANFAEYMLPVENALTAFESVTVSNRKGRLLLNGAGNPTDLPEGTYKMFDAAHGFLGLFDSKGGRMKVRTMYVVKEEAN